jgi:hypothetical protein
MAATFFDDALFAKTDGDTDLANYLWAKGETYEHLEELCVKAVKGPAA